MKVLQLAGAAALCGALLLTACAKKTTDQSTATSSTTDTSQAAGATPAADAAATTAPADATPAPVVTVSSEVTTSSSSSGNGTASGYIDLPVYPGATELKDQGMTASANGTSVAMKVYTTKDDTKRVAEWYKSHLPGGWKNGILTAGGKTVGTFSNEHPDGDQSVIVANADDTTTRIQLTTKHGK